VNAVDKINLGSFYTPEPVADLVLSLVLGGRDLAGVRLIDPTCGDGGFLALAVARGLAPSQLAGLDIDAEAVAAARARVPGVAVAVGDLFSAELGGGFTAVVGNPPYVRVERVGAATKGRVAATLARLYPTLPPRSPR
jgi:predicted RNA methylase